jgi:hypothetical protein
MAPAVGPQADPAVRLTAGPGTSNAILLVFAVQLQRTSLHQAVTTGSFAGKDARLDLDDLQTTRDYRPKRAYERSKLAQMLFGFELDRRLRAVGSTTPTARSMLISSRHSFVLMSGSYGPCSSGPSLAGVVAGGRAAARARNHH